MFALSVQTLSFVDVRPAVGAASRPIATSPAVCMQGPAEPLTRRESMAAALALVAALPAMPVYAESTLVTRQQAYTRYVPRIERGRDYWSTGLKSAIAKGDWATINAALDKKGSIDRLFGPMELWASSWSGKTISPKTVEMNAAIDELRQAAASLAVAAGGTDGKEGGFFGFFAGSKKLDDSKRLAIAQAAYKSGVSAINKYIEVGNDNLGLSFSQIDTID